MKTLKMNQYQNNLSQTNILYFHPFSLNTFEYTLTIYMMR